MTTNRKAFLLEPGDGLLISSDLDSYAHHWDGFTQASGLTGEQVTNTALATVPLPIYPLQFPPGQRRWEGTKTEFMWHPFMWLPPRLAQPARLPTGGAETLEQWIVRVMLEAVIAGFFDPETGTWLDVLATAGIDLDNPIDFLRVEGWLAGEPDELLDAINLDVYLPEDEMFGIRAGQLDTPGMVAVTAANMSADAIGYAEDAEHFINDTDVYQHQLNAATACVLSCFMGLQGLTGDATADQKLLDLYPLYAADDYQPTVEQMRADVETCKSIAEATLDKVMPAAQEFLAELEAPVEATEPAQIAGPTRTS